MYGAVPGESSFANNCLLARRLVERGVRFVQLFHEAWDHHTRRHRRRQEGMRRDRQTVRGADQGFESSAACWKTRW